MKFVGWFAPLCSLVLGCTTITEFGSEGSTGEAEPPGTTTTGLLPTGAGTGEATGSSSGAEESTSVGLETGGDPSGCGFLCNPDVPGIEQCDIWDDDCPRGEKCTFWANDGGNTINSTRCVPLAPNPVGPGEACTAEGLGFDDCGAGSMCWGFTDYPEGGACVPFCVGSPRAPTCDDPTRRCRISGGPLALCISLCDPLDPDACPAGQGCYPGEARFECAPDASGDAGGLFEPCEFTNACDAGLVCADPDTVGMCEAGVAFCCTSYCDLSDAAPPCPDGTTCTPFFAEGEAQPGYEDVGICGAP